MKRLILMMLMIPFVLGQEAEPFDSPEAMEADPEGYRSYITDNPEKTSLCLECYKQAIQNDPNLAGKCTECFENAAGQDTTILQDRNAFTSYAKGKSVNLMSVDGQINSFDGFDFSTDLAQFSMDDLRNIQNDQKIQGFRINADGSLEIVGEDIQIEGTVFDMDGRFEIVGPGGKYTQGGHEIDLLSGNLHVNDDGTLTIDGIAKINGHEVQDMKNIVLFETGFSGDLTSTTRIDNTQLKPVEQATVWIQDIDGKTYVAANGQTNVINGDLDAYFCTENTYPWEMPVVGKDYINDFRMNGEFIFFAEAGKPVAELNRGIVEMKNGDFYVKKPTFEYETSSEKATVITDVLEREFKVVNDDVKLCVDLNCVAETTDGSPFILFADNGDIIEDQAGLYAAPGTVGECGTLECNDGGSPITGSFGIEDLSSLKQGCVSLWSGTMTKVSTIKTNIVEWKNKPDEIVERTDDGTTFFHEYEISVKTKEGDEPAVWITMPAKRMEMQTSLPELEGYQFFVNEYDKIYVLPPGEDAEFYEIDVQNHAQYEVPRHFVTYVNDKPVQLAYDFQMNYEITPYSGDPAEEEKTSQQSGANKFLDGFSSPERKDAYLRSIDMTNRNHPSVPELSQYYAWCGSKGYKATVVGAYAGKGVMWNLVVEDPEGNRDLYSITIEGNSASTLSSKPPGWNEK